MMQHELRTPITASIQTLSLLLDKDLAPAVHEKISMMFGLQNLLYTIVNGLLDVRCANQNTFKSMVEFFSPSEVLDLVRKIFAFEAESTSTDFKTVVL